MPAWTKRLKPAERSLLECAETGKVLDLEWLDVAVAIDPARVDSQKDDTPIAFDPDPVDQFETMKAWGADRTIRADVLRHLLVASQWPVHPRGLRLRCARITGLLDLESATLRCPLVLQECYVELPVVLNYAAVSRIEMSDCLLGGLAAVSVIVTKGLDLRGSKITGTVGLEDADITGPLTCTSTHVSGTDIDGGALMAERVIVSGSAYLNGFTASGSIRLGGATITGQLSCEGAQIKSTNPDVHALSADGLKVGRGMRLNGFKANGAVWLGSADITGSLTCHGAQITGTDTSGTALVANGIKVGGSMALNDGFTAAGAVQIGRASITDTLTCRGARITCADTDGNALMADQAKVGGSVHLDDGFTAKGAVRLGGASITGQLLCSGAQLMRADAHGDVLMAYGVTVGGDVFLDDGFTAAGAVWLSGARIGGGLILDGAMLEGPVALMADGATIGQQLVWAPRKAVTGVVSLERTHSLRVNDDWRKYRAYWPDGGKLRLTAFTYDGFGGKHAGTCQQRLNWIRGQHQKPVPGKAGMRGKPGSYDSQPYEQLASVYRQAGQDTQAREILIAARNDLRTYGTMGRWRRLGNWLLDVTISHGYQPLRAVKILVAVYAIALGMFWIGQHQDALMVPTRSLSPPPMAAACTASYTCFAPAGYAIDVTIPIIKTGQADNWRPNAEADWGWLYLRSTWVFTGLGWALSTLAIAGYTGLVHKD